MLKRTIIIAEAGVNHNGSLQNALKLVDAASDAGVDYIKFQTFKSENLVSKTASKAGYQIENTKNKTETQLEMLKKLELSDQDHHQIIEYCKKKRINFFSTAFDLDSLKYLFSLGLEMVKIPSGEITNLPYLRLAARLFKNVILSTGMSTLEEIKQALDVFLESSIPLENITILHCNTEYPTPMLDVNLLAMINIKNTFGAQIGYSDHTIGIEVPIAAVAIGAKIIEKHFTLDKTLEGPDHAASLDPIELKEMVRAIRNIDLAISGSGLKEPSPSELKNIKIARKSIHIARNLSCGYKIKESDLIMLRPGDGISPMEIDSIIGRKIKYDLSEGQKLNFSDLE